MSDETPKPLAINAGNPLAVPAPDFISGGRQGFETMASEDIQFERIALMQDLSPEVKKEKKFLVGDIVRRSTGEVLWTPGSKPLEFTICFYFKEFVEFGDRLNTNEPPVLNRTLDRKSTLANESRTWAKKKQMDGKMVRKVNDVLNFIVIFKDRPPEPLLLSFLRTNTRHGSALLALANSLMVRKEPAPLFAGLYQLTSKTETNRRSQDYSVFNVKRAPDVWAPADMYDLASGIYRSAYEAFMGGKLKTEDLTTEAQTQHDDDGASDAGKDQSKGDF